MIYENTSEKMGSNCFKPFTSAKGIGDLFVDNVPLKHLLNLSINF